MPALLPPLASRAFAQSRLSANRRYSIPSRLQHALFTICFFTQLNHTSPLLYHLPRRTKVNKHSHSTPTFQPILLQRTTIKSPSPNSLQAPLVPYTIKNLFLLPIIITTPLCNIPTPPYSLLHFCRHHHHFAVLVCFDASPADNVDYSSSRIL